jgi:branched-chain amino acid transport system substrate-binding protein
VGAALAAPVAHAADAGPIKIGLILPMTGQRLPPAARSTPRSSSGWRRTAARSPAAGRGHPQGRRRRARHDRRLAQELIVNDKVAVLAGFGITPTALATAPLGTQSKTPMVVMAAATSSITQASPYIVRTSFTLPQVTVAIADWAAKNGIKKAISLVADYGPGFDAEKFFDSQFRLNGGQVLDKLRTPLRSPDFAPVLQKVAMPSPMRSSSSCPRARARPS